MHGVLTCVKEDIIFLASSQCLTTHFVNTRNLVILMNTHQFLPVCVFCSAQGHQQVDQGLRLMRQHTSLSSVSQEHAVSSSSHPDADTIAHMHHKEHKTDSRKTQDNQEGVVINPHHALCKASHCLAEQYPRTRSERNMTVVPHTPGDFPAIPVSRKTCFCSTTTHS